MPDEPRQPFGLWVRLASYGYLLLFLVLYASTFAGFAFDSRAAALLAVTALLATLTVHVVVAVVNYRRVMRREWPAVEPFDDEDDDW